MASAPGEYVVPREGGVREGREKWGRGGGRVELGQSDRSIIKLDKQTKRNNSILKGKLHKDNQPA